MNYHNITYPDMNNGSGLRVVLWCSACSHHCASCQNPQTWDANSGIPFDGKAEEELFRELSKDYISGLTLTGGGPLHENNLDDILRIVNRFRLSCPNKTIWLYSGYQFDDEECWVKPKNDISNLFRFMRQEIIKNVDVMVDGRYIDSQRDVSLCWRGSRNQRVIDVQKSIQQGKVVLYCD